MHPTRSLHDLGQSLWLDNITRDLLEKGTLERYVGELSVTGLTSNPTHREQGQAGPVKGTEALMGTRATETKGWRALQANHADVKDVHLRELFAKDPGRPERFAIEGAGVFLAQRVIPELESAGEPPLRHDASTSALIRRYRTLRAKHA